MAETDVAVHMNPFVSYPLPKAMASYIGGQFWLEGDLTQSILLTFNDGPVVLLPASSSCVSLVSQWYSSCQFLTGFVTALYTDIIMCNVEPVASNGTALCIM